MNALARSLAKLRFRILGLATIKNIPTARFNSVMEQLVSGGWRKTYEYAGIDAWVDYGKVRLQKDRVRLTLEWDNWTEGSIEGPTSIIEGIASDFDLRVTHEWRWAEYDEGR